MLQEGPATDAQRQRLTRSASFGSPSHAAGRLACNAWLITRIFQRQNLVLFAHARPMKATLYEALGISAAAPDEEVRAALRRLIRKYYAKTRDGQGNVEEALRFINHASRILGDHDRRVRYDQELAVSQGSTEQRIAHVVSNAMAEAGEQTDVKPPEPEPGEDEILETGLD